MRATRAMVAAIVLLAAAAAEAAVSAGARLQPATVGVGEASDLAVVVQGTQQTSTPTIPAVDGVQVRYVGPETQVSIVNGEVTASVTHHFNVTADREGTFAIGPITVDAEGQRVRAGSVTLHVTASGASGAATAPGEELSLVLSAPRTTVYLNERVPITIQLRVGAVQVGDVNYPRVLGDGFTVAPLAEPAQRQEQTSTGTVQVVDFRTAIVPARAGSLVVGPASMALVVLRPRPQRRSFFLGGPTRQQLELRSDPLTLEVLPLPAEGRPADFAGAVGRFTIAVAAAPADVGLGDPVTLTITVRGQGNLAAATPVGVAASDAFRVYPVQPAAQQPEAAAGEVHRVFEQVVIPQRAGTLSLPAVRLPFFAPEAHAYSTAVQPPIALAVRPAATPSAPQIVGAPGVAPLEPSGPLGRDIVSIKDAPGRLVPVGQAPWRTPLFWLLQALPLALAAGAAAWERRRRRLGDDPRFARFSAAGRAARAGLAAARTALARGDRAGCHDRVARTLSDYLAAKLDLPPGSVTPDRAGERLRAARVRDAVLDELRALWATCETARFAPRGGADDEAERTLARAQALVRACERERGLARALRAAAVLLGIGLAVAGVTGAAGADTPQALFYRGNALYADGRWADAAAAYEAARAQGVTSAALEYNLGNARVKAGDVGGAVLAYERARRLTPRDPDVQANLGFARPPGPSRAPPWWERLVFPLAGRWTTAELAVAASVAWWLACLGFVVGRLAPAASRAARRIAVAAAVAVVLAGGSAARRAATVDLWPAAVVTAAGTVTVRFEPSPTGTAHFEAAPGTLLGVLGERGDWLQVERADGLRGWLERRAVTVV